MRNIKGLKLASRERLYMLQWQQGDIYKWTNKSFTIVLLVTTGGGIL